MRKVILYSAASLDNFIARSNSDIEWLHAEEYALEGEDFGYADLMKSIDTTLMGNNTYEQIMGFDVPFPYQQSTNYVFTRSGKKENTEFANFINEDIPAFVEKLKRKKGKDIWLIGGGEINTMLLNNNLIDTVILTVFPIILGNGISLFQGDIQESRFQLEKCKPYKNGLVQLTYNRTS